MNFCLQTTLIQSSFCCKGDALKWLLCQQCSFITLCCVTTEQYDHREFLPILPWSTVSLSGKGYSKITHRKRFSGQIHNFFFLTIWAEILEIANPFLTTILELHSGNFLFTTLGSRYQSSATGMKFNAPLCICKMHMKV